MRRGAEDVVKVLDVGDGRGGRGGDGIAPCTHDHVAASLERDGRARREAQDEAVRCKYAALRGLPDDNAPCAVLQQYACVHGANVYDAVSKRRRVDAARRLLAVVDHLLFQARK